MKRAARAEHTRGFPPRSSYEEREALNGNFKNGKYKRLERDDGKIKRVERGTWHIKPRTYARLLQIIAELQIFVVPTDDTGNIKKALEVLQKMEKRSVVRWGNPNEDQ